MTFIRIWSAMTLETTRKSVWQQGVWDSSFRDRSVPIKADERNDLVIVGGGFLGLSSALHAARQGLSVRVLEAGDIGGAASGLNGGQVIAGFKYDPDWLLAPFRDKRGAEA